MQKTSRSRTLHIATRLRSTDSPSRVYATMAKGLPADVLVAFGAGVARELRQELRSWEAVADWAASLAISIERPIALNIPNGDYGSRTIVLAPNWSKERLAGWIAGRREEMEEAFGPIERVA